MKNSKIFYWTVTGLMAALIVISAIPDLLIAQQAVDIMGHLGYPIYLLPFLGVAKSAAIATILVPGVPRLKEWAFAGLTIDLVGALYSHLSSGDGPSGWLPAVIGLSLVTGTYLLHRARILERRGSNDRNLSTRAA
jgi:DoxX-like family